MLAKRAARKYKKIPSSKRPDVRNDYACQVTRPRDDCCESMGRSFPMACHLSISLCCVEARELDRSLKQGRRCNWRLITRRSCSLAENQGIVRREFNEHKTTSRTGASDSSSGA